MTSYFYFDSNGQKQGPVTEPQLKALAEQGVITPKTQIETDTGHKGFAEQIPWLKFGTAVHGSPTSNPVDAKRSRQTPHPLPPSGQSNESKFQYYFGWLTDFSFQDFWLPALNRTLCKIFYILSLIAIILLGLWLTFMLFASVAWDPTLLTLLGAIIAVPFVWIGCVFLMLEARLFYELCIIVIDWIFKTTKAAQIYIENSKVENDKTVNRNMGQE